LGQSPIRPPFLTARLISEGPGFDLLKSKCPAAGFEACRFIDRMPRDSDTFLWSLNPEDGVFSVVSHEVQRRLAEQDLAFALASLKHEPLAVILQSAESAVRQASLTQVGDVANLPPDAAAWDDHFATKLPEPHSSEVRSSLYARGRMPVAFVEITTLLSAVAAALFLATLAARSVGVGDSRRQIGIFAALILYGVAANAAVTGALSKPHHRYNTRVIWTLPLAALAVVGRAAGRKKQEGNRAADP
jgi:hypothetical protein